MTNKQYFLCPISFGVIYRGKFKYRPMCQKSSQLAAALLLIFCVDFGALGIDMDGFESTFNLLRPLGCCPFQ